MSYLFIINLIIIMAINFRNVWDELAQTLIGLPATGFTMTDLKVSIRGVPVIIILL